MSKYEKPTAEVLRLQINEEIATETISMGGEVVEFPDP